MRERNYVEDIILYAGMMKYAADMKSIDGIVSSVASAIHDVVIDVAIRLGWTCSGIARYVVAKNFKGSKEIGRFWFELFKLLRSLSGCG